MTNPLLFGKKKKRLQWINYNCCFGMEALWRGIPANIGGLCELQKISIQLEEKIYIASTCMVYFFFYSCLRIEITLFNFIVISLCNPLTRFSFQSSYLGCVVGILHMVLVCSEMSWNSDDSKVKTQEPYVC
jgi:hypothetical protein